MKKLKYISVLFLLCFPYQSLFAEQNTSIIDNVTGGMRYFFYNENKDTYFGVKKLDSNKVNEFITYPNPTNLIYNYTNYYKNQLERVSFNPSDYYYDWFKKYYLSYLIQQETIPTLYYEIKLNNDVEVTQVLDYHWNPMNMMWVNNGNGTSTLKIFYDSFFTYFPENTSGNRYIWKYEKEDYSLIAKTLSLVQSGETKNINFQFFLPWIELENQIYEDVIIPNEEGKVIFNFENDPSIWENIFYRGSAYSPLVNTKDNYTFENMWAISLSFFWKYDIFTLYENQGVFMNESCNISYGESFMISDYSYWRLWMSLNQAIEVKDLELEIKKFNNWIYEEVYFPYAIENDWYGRTYINFENIPLWRYNIQIKNFRSKGSLICENIYGIIKNDDVSSFNAAWSNDVILSGSNYYSYSEDIFEMFPPGWWAMNQKTSISSWDFSLNWSYRAFPYIKKFDVVLMNSKKEHILEESCILPENMTQEKILENIENWDYLQDQLNDCQQELSQGLSDYFHSSGKIEFPWIQVNYEDLFWVTHKIFSRFQFMPEDIPFITLRTDAFDENGQYFYFDTYNIYDDNLQISIIDENDDEIPITTYTYPESPSGEENYFDRDAGDELFIKNSQSFKKIIIKLYDELLYEKDFSLEVSNFEDVDLDHKSKMSVANKYSVDHLFSAKIWQDEDILFGRKIYIKKLKNDSSDLTWYNVQVSISGTLLWEIDPTKLYICSQEVIDVSTLWENLNCNYLDNLSERVDENDIFIPDEEWEEDEDDNTQYLDGVTFYEVRELYLYGISGLVSHNFQKLSVQFQITTFQEPIGG